MTQAPPDAEAQLRFLRQFQRLLDEGSFVATYKFALLHSIADLCVMSGDESGGALELSTSDIAERFIHLYWRQAVPFLSGREAAVLMQNTGRQAAVVREVQERHETYQGSLTRLQRDDADWRRVRTAVKQVVERMPLWKLQTVGSERAEFLYQNMDRGDSITLEPGVAYCFRTFYPMITEMVEGAWSRHIRRHNAKILGTSTDLRAFLFGKERIPLGRFRPLLQDLQNGRCFYCERGLGKEPQVDHFIPWRRYPLDLGHNFVLTHASCNSQKSDLLAAEEHLERWAGRNQAHGQALAQFFDAESIEHDLVTTVKVACWAYGQVQRAGGQVWVRGKEMRLVTRRWAELLPKVGTW